MPGGDAISGQRGLLLKSFPVAFARPSWAKASLLLVTREREPIPLRTIV